MAVRVAAEKNILAQRGDIISVASMSDIDDFDVVRYFSWIGSNEGGSFWNEVNWSTKVEDIEREIEKYC